VNESETIRHLGDQLQQARHAIAFAQKELADYRLRVARALGMYYGADGHADHPCSDDEAVSEIEGLKRDAAESFEAHCLPSERDEWNEEDGNVLWWVFPICEPPYCGTPLDDDFPDYVTHWTRIVEPVEVKL
jgi:hypothetical protein